MSKQIKDRTYRPLVYIASPLSGDVEVNTERARAFCRFALEKGQIPLAPHLLFPQFMNDDDPAERELLQRLLKQEESQDCNLQMK